MSDIITAPSHDPGGKVRLPLLPGVRGSALFSDCKRYRYCLHRHWGSFGSPYVLFIGMNPSTAEADVDDPTIRKEIRYAQGMGFFALAMVNVMDYRATDPKQLLAEMPRSDANLPQILDLAKGASRIVCAWGALPKPLRRYADDVVTTLHGYPLWCMGKTKNGAPRHPLYLPKNAECVPWP